MELGLRLSQKQTLKLVMTPRLQQALKLLQMPSLELQQHIKQELLGNPLLELEEENEDAPAPATESAEAEAKSPDETELTPEEDVNWGDYFDDGFAYSEGGSQEREDLEFYEKTQIQGTTLADTLIEQLHMLDLDEETLRIAEYLVGSLDERGFLTMATSEVVAELAVSEEALDVALATIQTLDPPGIGARGLEESLLIQLRLKDREDSLAATIVRDHFQALMQKQFVDIARANKVQPVEVQEAAQEIARLNPRPGAQLALEDSRYIVPDLVVDKVDEVYVVSLADGTVPRLRVSRKYRDILRRGSENGKLSSAAKAEKSSANGPAQAAGSEVAAKEGGKPAKSSEYQFVQEKLRSANWLIQTIEQRRRTMIKVMESIVTSQIDFFEKGPQNLRPLTLQDVAEKIGMHESTVSRVTTNKYVQTPRGVYPLKYFFSSGLGTESGESVSSTMAMGRIKKLVEKEDKKKPFSDQKIAELLREKGLIVARRTVAKYREKMGILSARYRKEY